MKKALSILVCYAVGMVAFVFSANAAVQTISSIDFSNPALWGKTPRYGLDDKGQYDMLEQKYWWSFGEGNASVITNYDAGMQRYEGFARYSGAPNPRPDYMASGADNRGYLNFQTVSPLARTFSPVNSAGVSTEAVVPDKDGLFVDTLAKFVVCAEAVEDATEVDVDGRAKFICWLSAPTGAGTTNLVVTAGRYGADGQLTRAHYVITNRVEADRWYRLTARAIRNASVKTGVSAPCFALYLDGLPVSCAAESYSIGENQAEMDDWFAGNGLYAARALFPPIRKFETTVPKLTGLAVQGCGEYDDFGVVNEGNPLAYGADRVEVVVSMNTNAVTNVICSVTAAGEAEPYFTTNSTLEAEVAFKVAPGDSVHVEAKPTSEYSLASELAIAGNVEAVAQHSGYDFEMVSGASFEDASRVTARINVGNAYFRVGDAVYDSIEDAMAAASASGTTLVLENDVTLDPSFSVNGQMRVRPTYKLVLDLHGRTLTGQNFRSEAAIYDQGELTVLDSVGGGAIIAPGTAIEVYSTNTAVEANYGFAALVLGDEAVRGDFTIKGRVRQTRGALRLMGGTYLTPWNLEPTNDFYLAEYIANERFGYQKLAVTEPIAGHDCGYWQVIYDGRVHVAFESEVGAADPAFTNVEKGVLLVEPAITNAIGYTTTNWFDTATGKSWDFAADTVAGALTLRAQQRLDTYSIAYDVPTVIEPSSYTVTSKRQALPVPTRANYTFTSWRDTSSGQYVAEVGKDATFIGTETLVAGDLDLVAQWSPDVLRWQNTTAGNAESNGTYAGSWTFSIPMQDGLPMGSTVVIDEIAFGIVNPHLYPKTAEYLKVTNTEDSVVSAPRVYVLDPATKEYLVGDDWLANGRAKVCYKFPDSSLKVKVGYKYAVNLCDAGGNAAVGFLRFALLPNANDPVFGNCSEAGGDPQSDDYKHFCPIYEVTGHPEEVNHE